MDRSWARGIQRATAEAQPRYGVMARLLRKRLFFVRRSRIHTSGPQGVPPTKAATDAAILYGLSRATVADRLFECLSSSGRPGDARW